MIISASRRTDIPAFYADWLLNRLRAGYVLVRSPRACRRISRVSLSPDDVDALVFWTKDPRPLLARLPELGKFGIPFGFQFTLTPYGRDLEKGLGDKDDIAAAFRRLSASLGAGRVRWRYDPIVLNAAWTIERHTRSFARLCESLEGAAEVCTISFVDLYAKLRNPVRDGILRPIRPGEMAELAAMCARIGGEHGMRVCACSEAMDLRPYGVQPARCLDPAWLEAIAGVPLRLSPARQREYCGCAESVDIGAYDTCRNGCTYCYANADAARVRAAVSRHDPASPLLTGWPGPEDVVTERRAVSHRQMQLRLEE